MKTKTEARDWFFNILTIRQEEYDNLTAKIKILQSEVDNKIQALFVSKFGKRKKFKRSLLGDIPEYQGIQNHYFGDYGIQHQLSIERQAIEEQFNYVLSILGEQSEIVKTEDWHDYKSVDESSYSTQGWGAAKYAKASADATLTETSQYVESKVEERFHPYDKPITTQYYGTLTGWTEWVVMVKTADIEILKRKPGLPLRDWIKACWKKGVNPRVYNPFLPTGLEDKLGLDYFGGEKKSA
jgi:hypothetical protein